MAGDVVKLLFKVDPPIGTVEVERMWVEVASSGEGSYTGRLANDPGYVPNIKFGDLVSFGPEHVAARRAGEDDPLYADPNAFAVVSRRVWGEGAWPARLERREPPEPAFGGWFVFAGDESADDRNDPSAFVPIVHLALIDRFPALDSGLEGPVGTSMTWNEQVAEYEQD